MMKKITHSEYFPLLLLVVISITISLFTYTHYGQGWDDDNFILYARESLNAYANIGNHNFGFILFILPLVYLTWAYLWSDPLVRLLITLKVLLNFPLSGKFLFDGILFWGNELARIYGLKLLSFQLTKLALVLLYRANPEFMVYPNFSGVSGRKYRWNSVGGNKICPALKQEILWTTFAS